MRIKNKILVLLHKEKVLFHFIASIQTNYYYNVRSLQPDDKILQPAGVINLR